VKESLLNPSLQNLVATLGDRGLTGREIAEAIWLLGQTVEADRTTIDIPTDPIEDPIEETPITEIESLSDREPMGDFSVPPAQAEIIPSPVQKNSSLALPPNYKPIPVPDAPALSQALLLARALRPLARQVAIGLPSVLDEAATVDRIAQTGVWNPVLKPESELWLDVALVFDTSPSMSLWQKLGAEVQKLLSRYGEFRDVRTWKLKHIDGTVKLTSQNGVECKPKELRVGDRRRLVVMISDCVAAAWHNGEMRSLVEVWSAQMPTVVFQVFPERLWARTALARSVTVEFQGQQAGLASDDLRPFARSVWDRDRVKGSVRRDQVRLPVVSLEYDALSRWAQVVAGDGRSRVLGIVWDAEPVVMATPSTPAIVNVKARMDAFVMTASPISLELAARLASAPVITLPIARIILKSIGLEASAVHMAEVFMSGLLRVSGAQVPTFKTAELVAYELIDEEVRDRLRSGSRVGDALDVFAKVSEYIAKGLGKSVNEFWAVLRSPGTGTVKEETEFLEAFARVSAKVLRGLGSEFEQIANSLAPALVEEAQSPVEAEDNFPELQDCEYQSIEITIILDRVTFQTATIERQRDPVLSQRNRWEIHSQITSTWGYTEILHRAAPQPPILGEQEFPKPPELGVGGGSPETLEMIAIPSGTFAMGAPEDESGAGDDEKPQHQVTVQSFYMGQHQVTQAQWRVVAGYPQIDRKLNPDPSDFKGDRLPIENVDWDDAQEFCKRLSAHTGKAYRLPSEAEWEYACRAGTITPFHFGETIAPELANYNGTEVSYDGPKGESRGETIDVGSLSANAWGLYDMHGNVWEWCEDDWHFNYDRAPTDGSAWVESDRENARKLLRGGSWNDNSVYCRSANRDNGSRDIRPYNVGFRVSCGFGIVSSR
jgi:formylglycine-generating enzyme required for sulfatase activity